MLVAVLSGFACGCAQPGFGKHADLLRADSSSAGVLLGLPEDGVRVTYFGTTSFLLQSRDGSVLIDPYFSRFGPLLLYAVGKPITRDQARIAGDLNRLPSNVDYIVVTHGHYDHLFDVPEVAERTGATVLLSATSYYQAAAAGLPTERMMVLRPHDTVYSDGLRITAYLGDHAPQAFGIHWYAGNRVSYPQSTRHVWDWKAGETLTFLIEMGGKRIFISSGNETKLPADDTEKRVPTECIAPVDLALVGVALKGSREWLSSLIECIQPAVIQPTHQDNLARPLSDGFRYGVTADMDAVRRAWDGLGQPGELVLLDYYKPWTLH